MKSIFKWVILALAIFLIILIPFLLWGESIENWTNYFLASSTSKIITGIVIGTLLSVDILAPVPSSLVSTAGGYFLGFGLGFLVSTTGMTVSCIIGYFLGANIGSPISKRLLGANELSKLEKIQNKYADWIIILSRAVPVLAETSVITAGIGRVPFRRFILLILLSNLGISLVYAAIGAYSAHINSFLLAFSGAVVIPAAAIFILKLNVNN